MQEGKYSVFSHYAKEDACVKNTSHHEFSLANEGYRPDILHLVEDKTLCALEIPAGDVLCLKQAVLQWWKTEPEHALKCRHEVLEGSPNTLLVEKLEVFTVPP